MNTVTKKHFESLHKNNQISLIDACWDYTAEKLYLLLLNYKDKDKLTKKPLSRVDIADSTNDGITSVVYSFEIDNKTYYIVETTFSKDSGGIVSILYIQN